MIWRNVAITVVLVAAILASWLLIERRSAPKRTTTTPVESGYYLRDAVIEGMDENGLRLYTLRAARIVERPGNGSVALEDVLLEYTLTDGPPWRVNATGGEIPASGDRIALHGGVTLAEQLMAGEQPTTIRTATLDVDLLEHRASTGDEVEIERGSYRMTAVGLLADLKAQTLTLQSDVHGRFLP